MLRLALSTVALAGVLAMAQPVFADPLTATASDHGQPGAAAMEQRRIAGTCMVVVIGDAPAATSARHGKNIARVGWLGLNAVPWGEWTESYCSRSVLLLALLTGIASTHYPSSASRDFASSKSLVSKPSVNQP